MTFEMPEFYGSTTVGERGQIVLPANVRKKLGIKPKDKILVMGMPDMQGIVLVKFEVIGEFLDQMDRSIKEMSKKFKTAAKAGSKK